MIRESPLFKQEEDQKRQWKKTINTYGAPTVCKALSSVFSSVYLKLILLIKKDPSL